MDRDETAAVLAVIVCGALVWSAGAIFRVHDTKDEAVAWQALWAPVIPAVVPLFALLGWAIADSEGPEKPALTRLVALFPFAVVWLRALVRAIKRGVIRAEGDALTTGLLRPRVTISERLRASLDANELAAVVAHEDAHARHLDPLRIWLAQIVTDLQWPFRRGVARQQVWLRALELARDEEAIRRGAEPTDLASAILTAVKLPAAPARVARAALGDDATFLETRIRHLLEPASAHVGRSSRLLPLAGVLALASFFDGLLVAGPIFAVVAGSP